MDKVNLTIDGIKVKARADATILESAREVDVYIPTLCSRPDLPLPLGDCRLCIVEIEGSQPRFPSSCTTLSTDGMVVHTNTQLVQELRRHFLKALLSPLPSPRLKRPELKRFAEYIGVAEEDLPPYVSRNLPADRSQPLFELDHNRCILCGLCVRMCKEVRGVGAIDFCLRDGKWMIAPFPSPILKENGCRFCGACVEVCPTGAITDKDDGWPGYEAKVASCTSACPAGIDVPRYVSLISQRRFAEAAAVIREKVPLPGVLGRVCTHPCETQCQRAQLNEPISIEALKRTAGERDARIWCDRSKVAEPTGKRVAIVGSGPVGLTAGYYLAKRGHSVIIFESLPELGGMMRVGIPAYRLPREVLDSDLREIKRLGIEIRTNTTIKSLDSLLKRYHVILLAVGAHKDQKLNITGEKNPSVIPGMVFLRKVNLSQKAKVGERVAVIGGGNVAIDAARTALRMGAKKVTLIYRRTRNEMPAYKEEIEEADKEGVKFQFLAAPTKIIYRDGKFTSLRCIRMELGEPDASGRRHPIPIKGSNFIVEADTIIPAIGQTPDLAFLKGMEIEATPEGTIKVDTVTLKTSKKGVFAAGDVISGPASVIEAVAMGRKAASSIDKYLGGSGDIDETLVDVEEPSPWLGAEYGFADLSRIQMACSSIVQRMTSARNGGFVEVKLGFSEDMAVKEAKRCLKCHLRFQVQRVATLQLNSPIK